MLDLVFLPATEPGDDTYGRIPERITDAPSAAIHQIRYPNKVWYNEAIRGEVIAEICALESEAVVLVGFSKSGLGAWNIARAIPDRIAGTIIFDAPVATENRQAFNTAAFYEDDTTWRSDLPHNTVAEFKASMPDTHSLALISGTCFHDEMCSLSDALDQAAVTHAFLPRPELAHHWNSGWIEEGLAVLRECGAGE